MRASVVVCAASAMLVVGTLGCGDSALPAADTTATAPPAAVPEPVAPVVVGGPPYRRGIGIDLTGDGVADSVHLEASGARADSQQIVLRLLVGGEEKHREAWAGTDEFAHLEPAARGPAVLRARLDSVLASVTVQRFDAPGVRIMAEDTAVLATLVPRPTQRISFAYGYETTVRLVWDQRQQRFVRLFSCC